MRKGISEKQIVYGYRLRRCGQWGDGLVGLEELCVSVAVFEGVGGVGNGVSAHLDDAFNQIDDPVIRYAGASIQAGFFGAVELEPISWDEGDEWKLAATAASRSYCTLFPPFI